GWPRGRGVRPVPVWSGCPHHLAVRPVIHGGLRSDRL
ncbi:MAG: hypothetical protein AVDCRST_MAG19-2128, partial [uncultured Thermomicrobiales bacterium]